MTTPSIPPPTHNHNMSQREAELGYPSGVNHGNRQLSFSLPSLPEMDLPRPTQSHGLPSKLDQLRVSNSKSSISCSPSPSLSITETEVDDDSSLPLKPRGGCTTPSPLSSTLPLSPASSSPSRSRAPSQSPSSSHTSSPTPTPGQSKPFSTWVPDDSLRFINPNFLSSAEKQTLEQQLSAGGSGKRKASTDQSMSGIELRGEAIQSSGHVNKEEEEEVNRPKKMGRPLGRDDSTIPTLTPTPVNLPYMFPVRERPSTFPSFLINRSSSRPPVPTSINKPPLHRSQTDNRSQTDDLDLLRQVKSNNLSIPSTGTGTSTSSSTTLHNTTSEQLRVQPHMYQHQHRHQQQQPHHPVQHQHHQQSVRHQSVPYQVPTTSTQATYPHTATRQHQQQKRHQHYEPPFTHAPLYHPPSSSNYTYRPTASEGTKKKPVQSSPDPHPDRNLAPPPSTHSPCSSSDITSPSVTTPDPTQKVSAATPLPPDDWRWGYVRRYGGRGRGQSGG